MLARCFIDPLGLLARRVKIAEQEQRCRARQLPFVANLRVEFVERQRALQAGQGTFKQTPGCIDALARVLLFGRQRDQSLYSLRNTQHTTCNEREADQGSMINRATDG